jgi:hypothetical protein
MAASPRASTLKLPPPVKSFNWPMSALGHKRTLKWVRAMSALPPKADIRQRNRHVRFVPKADIQLYVDLLLNNNR